MKRFSWSVGDFLVYRKSKVSKNPGPRAKNVSPSARGDSYGYTVDKYWIVKDVLPEGSLLVKTMRGKELTLPSDDPALRKPYIWERWFLRKRFRLLSESLQQRTEPA